MGEVLSPAESDYRLNPGVPASVSESSDVLYQSNLASLPLIHRGKVRDMYDVDERHLLIVTTDRLSAFDVTLPTTD